MKGLSSNACRLIGEQKKKIQSIYSIYIYINIYIPDLFLELRCTVEFNVKVYFGVLLFIVYQWL